MEASNNKIQAKDLINVGIFTAIYFVIFFAGMMLGYIPIFIPLLGLVCPILCGIPFMLYLTKVKKFGMVSLTGIILGLLNLVMGSGVLVLIFGIIFGVLGDVILGMEGIIKTGEICGVPSDEVSKEMLMLKNEYRKVDCMLERVLKEITLARIMEADLYL